MFGLRQGGQREGLLPFEWITNRIIILTRAFYIVAALAMLLFLRYKID